MSAEVLREAATLMRERAEVAGSRRGGRPAWFDADSIRPVLSRATSTSDADAEHIAAMSPAVALVLADWLMNTAATWVVDGRVDNPSSALAVADAYLGNRP